MPHGRTLLFKHTWAPTSRWVIVRTTLREGANDVSTVDRQYDYRSVVPWGDLLGGVPVTSLERIVQDGQAYTTQFEYSPNDLAHRFGDYHRLYKITKSGQLTRITEREFDYAFDFYVLDRTKSVTVSMGTERFTTSYDYEDSNGFLSSETVNHVTTTYSPGLFGNRASATDANGNTAEFTSDWGVVKNTTAEEYGITRTINSDGTVHDETRGGVTTTFGYDALRRLTSVSIPGRDTTSTAYAADGSSVTVSRGTTFTTTFLDGYGRSTGTSNAVGVHTRIAYDALGLKTFQSYPYDSTDGSATHGDSFEYDALGRVTRVIHPDVEQSSGTYAYGGTVAWPDSRAGDVRITDEEGRETIQRWRAFGDPSDARLVSLRDAYLKDWAYGYNALGSLTHVGAPDGSARTWVYDEHNWLRSETHPESETTTYDYWPAGNLRQSETQAGCASRNRVSVRWEQSPEAHRAPDGVDRVDIEYDDFDNRTRVVAHVVDSQFEYPNNRLERRRDTMAATPSGRLITMTHATTSTASPTPPAATCHICTTTPIAS